MRCHQTREHAHDCPEDGRAGGESQWVPVTNTGMPLFLLSLRLRLAYCFGMRCLEPALLTIN